MTGIAKLMHTGLNGLQTGAPQQHNACATWGTSPAGSVCGLMAPLLPLASKRTVCSLTVLVPIHETALSSVPAFRIQANYLVQRRRTSGTRLFPHDPA